MYTRFWLVQCGDDVNKVTFAIHPQIHFKCSHCGGEGGATLYAGQKIPANDTHTLIQKALKFKNQREYIAFMEQPEEVYLKALVEAPIATDKMVNVRTTKRNK
jgi:hypothetical protein